MRASDADPEIAENRAVTANVRLRRLAAGLRTGLGSRRNSRPSHRDGSQITGDAPAYGPDDQTFNPARLYQRILRLFRLS